MKLATKHLAIAAASMAIAAQTASAAFTFNDGDVILGFQAVGSTTNVYFNLGSGTALRDGTTTGILSGSGTVLANTLASVYGSDWYSRTDLYFGAIGNLNTGIPTGSSAFGNKTPAVNGDPSRTFYVSRATDVPGTSNSYTGISESQLGTAGGLVSSTEGLLGSNVITSINDQIATFDTAGALAADKAASWSDNNPLINGGQGAGYGLFSGGIQSALGSVNPQTFIDIQRIIPVTNGASPSQTVGQGFTVASIALGNNGNVSVIPEPTTGLLAGIAGLCLVFRRRRAA